MKSSEEIEKLKRQQGDLIFFLEAALEWIDAVPSESVASFPAMPGFCRDTALELIESCRQDMGESDCIRVFLEKEVEDLKRQRGHLALALMQIDALPAHPMRKKCVEISRAALSKK